MNSEVTREMEYIGFITKKTFDELMNKGFTLFNLGITSMRMLYKDSNKNIVVSLTIRQEKDGVKWYYLTNEINISENDWQHMTTAGRIEEFEHRFSSLAYFARSIRPIVDKLLSEEGFKTLEELI